MRRSTLCGNAANGVYIKHFHDARLEKVWDDVYNPTK